MPIYGYHCDECGHELEIFQSMSDAPLKNCPVCGGSLRKLLYPVGVQFKGSGFYTTDYRNGSRSGSKSTEGASESGDRSEAKPSGDSTSKPTTKSSDKSDGKKSAAVKDGD